MKKKPAIGRREFFKAGGAFSAGLAIMPFNEIVTANHMKKDDTKYAAAVTVGYVTSPEAAYRTELGLGFNWFEYFGSGGYYARWKKYPLSAQVYPEPDDKKGWEAIEKGLNELNPGWLRFGMPPDPHVDQNGSFNGNTIHFKHLEWLHKWASKNNRIILLDTFLMPKYYEFPLPEGTREPGDAIVNMAAKNNREYAENFVAPMINYVINGLKLKSVKYFNPINEAMEYGVYQTPDIEPNVFVHYIEMYREIRRALDHIGITREKVGLVGFDTSFPIKYALEELSQNIDISGYIDAYSVHHYNLRLDYAPPEKNSDVGRGYFNKGLNVTIEQDDKMFLEFARKQNKSFWALEMGTLYYGKWHNPAGVASIDATITVAEAIIRAINIGITSFCIWSMMNPNDVDGHWAVMGQKDGELIRYKYPYAVYGLIANHFSPDSKVYPVFPGPDSPGIVHVHATFLDAPNGDKTILVVNDHPDQKQTVVLSLPGSWNDVSDFKVSLVNKDRLNESAGNVSVNDGKIKLQCEPFSLLGLKA